MPEPETPDPVPGDPPPEGTNTPPEHMETPEGSAPAGADRGDPATEALLEVRLDDPDDGPGDSPEDVTGEAPSDGPADASTPAKTRLSREQARELAEAERVEREAQLQRQALELARADAERLLAGPGLVNPDLNITPADLESRWSPSARAALAHLRADLESHRVGLAISGGGSLGSFEAGALRFLYDHTDLDPVAICGNSAGALNAAKLAEGTHSDQRPIDEVERIWRSLRINSDMWEPEPWLVRLQASASWAAALREQVSDSDSAASAVRVAVRVVGSLVRRPPETDGTLDAIRESLRAQSLLSLAPIAELVRRELRPDRVAASGVALRMGTVSLEAGELRYVTETGELVDRHDQPVDQPPVDLASGVLASASIPLAFPPVALNDEHYVDGGAREILPLELLVERMGVQRVIAVAASSASIKRAPSFADRNMIDILRRVSAEIGPNETLRKELDPPGGWRPEVRLVVPRFNVHDSMTIDPALIAISFDHGYLRAADVLLQLDAEANDLTEQITRIRVQLRHLAGPVPTIFDTTLGRARRQLGLDETTGSDTTPDGAGIAGDAGDAGDAGVVALDESTGPDGSAGGTDTRGEQHLDEVDARNGQEAGTGTTDGPDAGEAEGEDEDLSPIEATVRSARSITASGMARITRKFRDLQDTDGPDQSDDDERVTGDDAPLVLTEGPTDAVGLAVADARAEVAAQELAGHETEGEAEAREAAAALADAHEAARLLGELRALLERRRSLGLPLPRSLSGWLDQTAP